MEMQLFLELLGTFFSGAIFYIILEASKYGQQFDVKIFYKKNIKPMKWTFLGAVGFMLLVAFVPTMVPFVEVQAGGEINISSYEGIMMGGTLVGGILKAFIENKEKKKLQEAVEN